MTFFKKISLTQKLTYKEDSNKKYPSVYYGYCYYERYLDKIVFCIFPFNYLVRIWRAYSLYQQERWHYLAVLDKYKGDNGMG